MSKAFVALEHSSKASQISLIKKYYKYLDKWARMWTEKVKKVRESTSTRPDKSKSETGF